MRFEKGYIPYGCYWSTPFCKWQGSLAAVHPVRLAADCARQALNKWEVETAHLTGLYFGNTIPSPRSFYGAPWLAGLIEAGHVTGPTISQACATSTRLIADLATRLECSEDGTELLLGVAADRTSNGPHLAYPNPFAPGGRPDSEDWVWDNFNCDPLGRNSMIETAENVACKFGISTEKQHEVVLIRHQQYSDALAHDRSFQKRYMLPVEVNPTGRKVVAVVETDEGVFPTSAEGLAKLRPVVPEGTVTFGGQTYPADGNAGMMITHRSRAKEISRQPETEILIVAAAEARAEQGYMPMANLPAVQAVLKAADLNLEDIVAFKTHNPFAVNDVYLAGELGLEYSRFNNYGSSLIWGHPQAPTAMRLVIELIEELEIKGGGYGLFTGCAAGDTAAALILKVA